MEKYRVVPRNSNYNAQAVMVERFGKFLFWDIWNPVFEAADLKEAEEYIKTQTMEIKEYKAN